MNLLARFRRKLASMTLWYRRLQTDKDPRYAVANLVRLQELYNSMNASDRTAADEMITKIISHLVMANGTVMVSRRGRHIDAIDLFLKQYATALPTSLRVLELGCSLGIDGMEMFYAIRNAKQLDYYHLADLHTRLHFDPEHQLAYDEDGELVQAFVNQRAVSLHVSGYFRWTKWLMTLWNMPHVSKARNVAALAAGTPTFEVPLLHPEVLELTRKSELASKRQNVLEPIAGNYDLVIAFNLLLSSYFTQEQLLTALRNLRSCLPEGGFLILGRESSDFSVYRKSDGELLRKFKRGHGSDCDTLIASLNFTPATGNSEFQ